MLSQDERDKARAEQGRLEKELDTALQQFMAAKAKDERLAEVETETDLLQATYSALEARNADAEARLVRTFANFASAYHFIVLPLEGGIAGWHAHTLHLRSAGAKRELPNAPGEPATGG